MVKIGKIGKNWKSERASRKRVLPARRSFPVLLLSEIETLIYLSNPQPFYGYKILSEVT